MFVGRTRLVSDLRSLGVREGAVALVHCRMSALGTVIGGAETVVRALLDCVGASGTLIAYIGWEDGPPDQLDALSPEDRELVLAEHPVYDPQVGRARRDHGRLAEALRTWPAAVHSGHPEAGVVAIGARAHEIAITHPLDDAYGDGTPYARVVESAGQVVMLGAPLSTVTLIHHAETIAAVTGKRRTSWRVPLMVDGERTWVTLLDVDTSSGALDYRGLCGDGDYVEWLAHDALASGAGRTGSIGAGVGHVFDAHALVTHTVRRIEDAFGSPR